MLGKQSLDQTEPAQCSLSACIDATFQRICQQLIKFAHCCTHKIEKPCALCVSPSHFLPPMIDTIMHACGVRCFAASLFVDTYHACTFTPSIHLHKIESFKVHGVEGGGFSCCNPYFLESFLQYTYVRRVAPACAFKIFQG